MIKGVDKDDPNYARTLVVCSSTDTYLDWSEDSMSVEGSELMTKTLQFISYYEEFDKSVQQVWTDDVPRLKAKYDADGMPMEYIDMNKIEGRVDLSKGEKTTGKGFCGAVTYELSGE